MNSMLCGHCGASVTGTRDGRPFCTTCGICLVRYDPIDEWVSCAERNWRESNSRSAARIEKSRLAAEAGISVVCDVLPDGWRAETNQIIRGAPYQIDIYPPPGPVDAHAYMHVLDGGLGWHVGIYNRTCGVEFPLYTAGGVRAATYSTVREPAATAVKALMTEINDPRSRVPLR